jgi:hypothetical protein
MIGGPLSGCTTQDHESRRSPFTPVSRVVNVRSVQTLGFAHIRGDGGSPTGVAAKGALSTPSCEDAVIFHSPRIFEEAQNRTAPVIAGLERHFGFPPL